MLVENTSINFIFFKKITPQNKVGLKLLITTIKGLILPRNGIGKVNQKGIYQTPGFI